MHLYESSFHKFVCLWDLEGHYSGIEEVGYEVACPVCLVSLFIHVHFNYLMDIMHKMDAWMDICFFSCLSWTQLSPILSCLSSDWIVLAWGTKEQIMPIREWMKNDVCWIFQFCLYLFFGLSFRVHFNQHGMGHLEHEVWDQHGSMPFCPADSC